MLRALVCSVVALGLFVNAGLCGDEAKKKKKKGGLAGEIIKVDAEKGTLTVKVAVKKKQFEEKEFKVTDQTTLTASNALELLKKDAFKPGAKVTIQADEAGTATAITLGVAAAKKKKKEQ